MALFIDCDDTLVTWLDEYNMPLEGQNPHGGGNQNWRFNPDLVKTIMAWVEADPKLQVVIWSGGGADYARDWLERLFAWSEDGPPANFFSMWKNVKLPREYDVVVDDMPDLVVAGTLYTPQEFIELG